MRTRVVVVMTLLFCGVWLGGAAPTLVAMVKPSQDPVAATSWVQVAAMVFGPTGVVATWLATRAVSRARERKRRASGSSAGESASPESTQGGEPSLDELVRRFEAHERECVAWREGIRQEIHGTREEMKEMRREVVGMVGDINKRIDEGFLALMRREPRG